MSIQSFIRKVCVQDIVYWEFDGKDAYSTPQFKDPVDRKARWDEHTEIISDSNGKEYLSNAQLLVPEDMEEQSYVWLGDIRTIDPETSPLEIENAFEVKKMDRHPTFRSSTFDVFIAYL